MNCLFPAMLLLPSGLAAPILDDKWHIVWYHCSTTISWEQMYVSIHGQHNVLYCPFQRVVRWDIGLFVNCWECVMNCYGLRQRFSWAWNIFLRVFYLYKFCLGVWGALPCRPIWYFRGLSVFWNTCPVLWKWLRDGRGLWREISTVGILAGDQLLSIKPLSCWRKLKIHNETGNDVGQISCKLIWRQSGPKGFKRTVSCEHYTTNGAMKCRRTTVRVGHHIKQIHEGHNRPSCNQKLTWLKHNEWYLACELVIWWILPKL